MRHDEELILNTALVSPKTLAKAGEVATDLRVFTRGGPPRCARCNQPLRALAVLWEGHLYGLYCAGYVGYPQTKERSRE